jgi:hypothetical protein
LRIIQPRDDVQRAILLPSHHAADASQAHVRRHYNSDSCRSHGDQRGVDREAGTQHLPTDGQQQQHSERNGRSDEQRQGIHEQMTAA